MEKQSLIVMTLVSNNSEMLTDLIALNKRCEKSGNERLLNTIFQELAEAVRNINKEKYKPKK